MEELLAGLNPEQMEAATTTEGYIRVIAGAGTGKTRALARRFAFLVNEVGIMPGNILCVTFTNKSAAEMRQRIHALTGDNDTGYICTFHSFCCAVLQEDGHAVSYPKNFLVLDNADIDEMLKIIYEEQGLTLRDMTFSRARDMIEILKTVERPDYYLDMIAMPLEQLHRKYTESEKTKDKIFYGYLYQEKKCFALDYNDLIKFSLYIFENSREIREKWQRRLEYIMIDEFQDIDPLQYTLMEVLCGYHGNLFVVGDPDQTIYTWRGADIRFLMDFDRNFSPCTDVMMMRNYRSTPQIIRAANSLIEKNRNRIRKELIPTRPEGKPVAACCAKTAEQEAEWIADEIEKLRKEGIRAADIAILYRAHYVTRTLEEVFLQRKIPYSIYSGVQFFARAEIKDALAYLRMAAMQDDLSFRRIINTPKRNVGKRRMEFLEQFTQEQGGTLFQALRGNLDHPLFQKTGAAGFVSLIESFSTETADKPISQLLAEILDQSGYEMMLRTEGAQNRLDNLAELKQSVYDYEISCGEEAALEDYLRHVALFTAADAESRGEKVKLMTVHTAKGLEFPVVFLCALSEGIFPSGKTKTMPAMEEERRLAFVAMTRAQNRLYLSSSAGRNFDFSPRYPSRFLLEIDSALLNFELPPEESVIREAKSYIAASQLRQEDGETENFPEGTRVRHSVFGTGTVTGVDRERRVHMIQFDDLKTPRGISFRAKLERIDNETG